MNKFYGFLVVLFSCLAMVTVTPVMASCIADGAVSNFDDCVGADKGAKDCLLAWSIDFDGNGAPPIDPKKGKKTTKVVCRDGDACDADGYANGVCTFALGVCANAGPDCAGAAILNINLKKPSTKGVTKKSAKAPEAYYNRRTVLAALGSVVGNSSEVCSADDLKVRVPLKSKRGVCASPAGQRCLNDQDCDNYCVLTYKKNKAVIKVIADDGGSNKDADALKLFCLPNSPGSVTGAEAFRVTDPADLVGGPLAMGRTGDWMIRNGNLRVVVRDSGRVSYWMVSNGGHIIDADLVRDDPADDRDNWQGVQLLVNTATQATTNVVVLNDGSDGNPAILRTTGPDDLFDQLRGDRFIFYSGNTLSLDPVLVDKDLPIALTTDYILRPEANYVEIATTVENLSDQDLDLLVGDWLNPGGQLEVFGPGLGYGVPLLRLGGIGLNFRSQGLDHMSFQGHGRALGVTYGFVFPRTKIEVGINKFVEGTHLTGAFGTAGIFAWMHKQHMVQLMNLPPLAKPTPPFHVPAGGTNTLRRWFVVGSTVADVTRAREELFGYKVGVVQGVVTANGQPVSNADVALVQTPGNNCAYAGTANCANVYTGTTTDEHGFYRAWAVPGIYNVQFRGPGYPYEGSGDAPANHMVTVKARKTHTVNVDFPSTGALRVLTVDHNGNPIAAKVSVVGFPKSPDPLNLDSLAGFIDGWGRYFGYDSEEQDIETYGLARVKFADHSGDTGSFTLEPGDYRVVVSHGPEYSAYSQGISIAAGQETTVNATVNQVVDTSGFVSIDTHVHMIASHDSSVPNEDRIVTMLAEGVDFFANTDHDAVHSLSDEVAAMGVGGLIKTVAGSEITTFTPGHFNVWPLQPDPSSVNGGALDWGRSGEPVGFGYPENGSYDLLPAEVYAAFDPATQVIQINHFNSALWGHFANLGIDTEVVPPASTDYIYRCDGGLRPGLPCQLPICLGGTNDGALCGVCSSGPNAGQSCESTAECPKVEGSYDYPACTPTDSQCPGALCNVVPVGRDCPAGACVDEVANLGAFMRLDPAVANLYDDGYTALEVWIEASAAQTELAFHDNLADWAGLLNQGIFKTGIADSDTHSKVAVQAGGPRTYVASPTDDPASIDPAALALAVNAGRAVGAGGIFMRVNLEGDVGAQASHSLGSPLTVNATSGNGVVNVHLESPTWAQFDTVDIYMNSDPECGFSFTFDSVLDRKCDVEPQVSLHNGVDFNITTQTGVSGFGQRLVADISQPVSLVGDTWVIVVARGTDGVSSPLFPMNPQNLEVATNTNLLSLTDYGTALPWNLGQEGSLAAAFSNPLFFDAQGDGLCHGGTVCP